MSTELTSYNPEAALTALKKTIAAEYGTLEVKPIESIGEFQLVDAKLGLLKKSQKAWTAAEKSALEPLKEMTARVKDYFADTTALLKACEEKLKGTLLAWHKAEEAKRKAQEDELNRKAKEDAEKKRKELEEEAALAADVFGEGEAKEIKEAAANITPLRLIVPQVTNTGGSSSVRTVRKWRVVNAQILPREYLVPDETRLSKECRAGAAPPPGVEYFDEPILAGRSR